MIKSKSVNPTVTLSLKVIAAKLYDDCEETSCFIGVKGRNLQETALCTLPGNE